jgi:hypothetical protein
MFLPFITSSCKNYTIIITVLQGFKIKYFSTDMLSFFRVYPKTTVMGVLINKIFICIYGGGVDSEMSYDIAFIVDLRALSRLTKLSPSERVIISGLIRIVFFLNLYQNITN